jgi:beta-glucosidase
MSFPSGFLWGVATSGHQTEGFNTASDTWFAEHVSPTVFREPSGAACNAYEMWAADVDRVAAMGLTAFRFSVEWARVEPSPGKLDEVALAHYGAIVDRCRDAGLAAIVTFNHMTSPHWFAARGGWLDDEAPSRFAAYCGAVTEHIGSGMAFAVTLNEPNLPQLLSWADVPSAVGDLERATLEAAARDAGVPRYRLANVMLPEDLDAIADGMAAGHSAARAAIKAVRPELPVGFSLAVADDQAVGDSGVRDQKRSQVYARWLRLASGDDFLGVQNYERLRYDANGLMPPPAGAPLNDMGSDIYPLSLANAVQYAHASSGVPILVTEHGLAHDDDRLRAGFIPAALDGLHDAVRDGIPVLGYLHWTLMDNFEWASGYGMRLGLHEVDRTTFARTPKPSAAVYAAIARRYSSLHRQKG